MAFEMEAAEQTRRLQQEQKSAAELEFRPAFDPLKHTPEIHVKKILISKKIRPIESLAAAKARVENDARFFKDKLLDLAIQSRAWMRDAATVDKAIDKAFSSPPSDFPASVLYSRAARFNEKHNFVRSRSEGPAVATHDANILSKDAFDAEGSSRN
jgi:hypothetical protein